jgi:hypothetical protein
MGTYEMSIKKEGYVAHYPRSERKKGSGWQ